MSTEIVAICSKQQSGMMRMSKNWKATVLYRPTISHSQKALMQLILKNAEILDEIFIRNHNELAEIKEILLAINPSTEGEATMLYLSKLLKSRSLVVTRIASGIPLGAHLEFIDDATIGRAIQSRREM